MLLKLLIAITLSKAVSIINLLLFSFLSSFQSFLDNLFMRSTGLIFHHIKYELLQGNLSILLRFFEPQLQFLSFQLPLMDLVLPLPLDQDTNFLVKVILERESMDFSKSDHVEVLLQSGIVLTHLISGLFLIPSFELDVTGLITLVVKDFHDDSGWELSPYTYSFDRLLNSFLMTSPGFLLNFLTFFIFARNKCVVRPRLTLNKFHSV